MWSVLCRTRRGNTTVVACYVLRNTRLPVGSDLVLLAGSNNRADMENDVLTSLGWFGDAVTEDARGKVGTR